MKKGRKRLFYIFVLCNYNEIDFVDSSPSNIDSKYNTFNYDLTTPMFTPDGRLLQIEYAGNACRYSSPLIAIAVQRSCEVDEVDEVDEVSEVSKVSEVDEVSENEEYPNDAIVLATLLSPLENNEINEVKESFTRKKRITRAQKRIVEIPTSPNNVRYGGGGLVMGLTGVLSDNVALVKQVHEHMETWYRQYGLHSPYSPASSAAKSTLSLSYEGSLPSSTGCVSCVSCVTSAALRIANVIGDACQNHSFGGGIRPFGASTIVCALESKQPQPNAHTRSRIAIYTTYPSGSVLKHTLSAHPHDKKNMNKRFLSAVVVVGGESVSQQKLKEAVHAQLISNESNKYDIPQPESIMIKKAVNAAIKVLCDEYQSKRVNERISLSDHDQKSSTDQDLPLLEIVVISSKSGVQYLDQDNILKLIRKFI